MTETMNQCTEQIMNCLRNSPNAPRDRQDLYTETLFAAYALFRAKQANTPTLEAVKGYPFISVTLSGCWEALSALAEPWDMETLRQVVLAPQFQMEFATPSAVVSLALRLLDISDSDTVIDLGTGSGGFLIDAYRSNPSAEYLGIELNPASAAIASVRAELLGENVKVEQADMFTLRDGARKFSKVFSHYPFGMKDLHRALDFDAVPGNSSSDWLFNHLMVECLSESGKAVGLMTRGACFNKPDSAVRKHFIESGLIEAVIALPEKLLPNTQMATVVVVLSRGNRDIRMVDASELCEKGRRQNELTENHISAILDALHLDSGISRTVTATELAHEDYSLDPVKLLTKPVEVKGGVALGDVAGIRRGSQITAKELDEMVSGEPTDYQYLRLCDIEDGAISGSLPYLKELVPRLQKYCVVPGNLLLSRNGSPFKMAVVEDCHGKSILATGNLLILEPKECIRPLYLKAFLESEAGMQALNSALVGTTIPVIQTTALQAIQVPCPPLQEQLRVEGRYLASLRTIQDLKQQLASAIEASKSIFEEVEQ